MNQPKERRKKKAAKGNTVRSSQAAEGKPMREQQRRAAL
jgi:hypothetical protein